MKTGLTVLVCLFGAGVLCQAVNAVAHAEATPGLAARESLSSGVSKVQRAELEQDVTSSVAAFLSPPLFDAAGSGQAVRVLTVAITVHSGNIILSQEYQTGLLESGGADAVEITQEAVDPGFARVLAEVLLYDKVPEGYEEGEPCPGQLISIAPAPGFLWAGVASKEDLVIEVQPLD